MLYCPLSGKRRIRTEEKNVETGKSRKERKTMSQSKRILRGTILTLVGGVAWGFSGACGQYIFANSRMDSGMLASLRMLGAGILLLLFCLITRKKEMFRIWKHPVDAFRLVLFAVGGLMFTQYAYLTAIGHSNSGTATVFQNTGVVLVMVVSCILARRLPRGKEVLAAILTIAGVFLLATHGKPGELVIAEDAFLWGALAALALVTYTMLPMGLLEKWGTPVVNGFAMLIGGMVLFVGFRVWERSWDFSMNILLALAGIILFGTLMAFTFYLQGVSDIGPMKASMLACVEPVVATIVSALWLGTEFAWIDLVGFVLIIGGCVLVSLSGQDQENKKGKRSQKEVSAKERKNEEHAARYGENSRGNI